MKPSAKEMPRRLVAVKPYRFNKATCAKLRETLKDQAAAGRFIHEAQGALEAYSAMNLLGPPVTPDNPLGAMPARKRGRPFDGAQILLFCNLADAFGRAGGYASGNERSRFVRAIKAINAQFRLCAFHRSDPDGGSALSQKVKDALRTRRTFKHRI